MEKISTLNLSSKILIKMIIFYQYFFSPFLSIGVRCRFYPTCSNYAINAIMAYGSIKGIWLTVKRLLKCHPLHKGGYDPIPIDNKSHKSNL